MNNEDYIVRVKAQVMTRDDSTGGWVPMGGGGLSIVGLRKIMVTRDGETRPQYHVYGQRIADQSVVLDCVLKKDVQYNKVTPTFHHWKMDEKKFGLTFQSAADARAFDRGLKRAIEDLHDGSPDSSNNTQDLEVGDDEVFMTIDLPLERENSSSSSTSSRGQARSIRSTHSYAGEIHTNNSNQHHHLHRMHFVTRTASGKSQHSIHSSLNGQKPQTSNASGEVRTPRPHTSAEGRMPLAQQLSEPEKLASIRDETATDEKIEVSESYSYVQFAREQPSLHEYSYPDIETVKPEKRESISSVKKVGTEMAAAQPPLLPRKGKKNRKRTRLKHSERSRCRYCQEMYVAEENLVGNCEEAPDRCEDCINTVSCMVCARCMLYHCMSDPDGDYIHPCSCDISDDTCCRRWLGLTLLSLFVPCLWCYQPLRLCHQCGSKRGCFGGRHKAYT